MAEIRVLAPEVGVGPETARLAELRDQIDRLDASLIETLAARYRLAEQVGTLKGGAGIPVLDPSREASIVRRASEGARDEGVPAEGMRQLFWQVLDYCREGVRGRHLGEKSRTDSRLACGG